MALIPFGEYRPDVSDWRGQYSKTILNVFPQGDGYGPVKDVVAATSALPAVCRGFFFARLADSSVKVFAGTSDRLYVLDNTDLTWDDVSKGGAAYTALPATGQWQFRQFNNFVFSVQQNAAPQVFDVTSSTTFADLGGSPPLAAYVSIVNRFVVLSGLQSNNTRVQWSGLNATTTWTAGTSQSDFQDLPDGGNVLGVAGGSNGVIFQDASIRRMIYAPGSPYVFGIDRISSEDGMLAPYCLIEAGDRIFYCSPQGFKMLVPGGYPQPIGKERVDRTFLADYDSDHPELFIGAHDPTTNLVMWAYKSINNAAEQLDTVLYYDWALDRWSTANIAAQYLAPLSRPGMTLETVATVYGSDIDALSLSSFDNIAIAARPRLAAITSLNEVGFFTGDNLEATVVTAEQGDDSRRMRCRGFRPVTDAIDVVGSMTTRETAQSVSTTTDETALNSLGICEQNVTGRYMRARARIPAGSDWTFISGVEPDILTVGRR